MRQTPYYSIRTSSNPNEQKVNLPLLRKLVREAYLAFESRCYFQEAFGYFCVDAGHVNGKLNFDVRSYLFRRLRKDNLWPIETKSKKYSDDDVFDILEFLYDCISRPIDGRFHSFNDCGWHYDVFDQEAGQKEFRADVNNFLCDYAEGYELSETGEIYTLTDPGLETLLTAQLPDYAPHSVTRKVNAAITRFRHRGASLDDRHHAVRDLADVLESLRPKAGEALNSKDEGDLFNLANNFGLRHHNEKQKTNYDERIWYSWMFYYYLATIHASLRLIMRLEEAGGS